MLNPRRRHVILAGLAAIAAAVTALTLSAASAPAAAGYQAQPRQAHGSADPTDLDVTLNESGTTIIPLVSVTVTVTYTCNDSLGTARVPVTVTLDQGGSGGHTGSTTVNCQVTGGTASILVLFVGVKTGTEIDAIAQIDNSAIEAQATDTADLVTGRADVAVNPYSTLNSNGSVTVTGTYTCDGTTAENLAVTLQQDAGGTPQAGLAQVNGLTCPASNQPWTATVAPASGSFSASSPATAGLSEDGALEESSGLLLIG
jgi:hypothetical protein